MTKKERLNKIFQILEKKFGKPKCALDFETPFQLMVAVILSAQCTDERVNIVTKELFKVVREPQDIRNMDIKKLEKYIKSTGFYKNKAKNIKLNVVLGEIWDIREGIVVDTHVKRLSNHIGFVKSENPEIIERELMKFVLKKNWFEYSHYLILHGRDKCKARKPQCEMCEINEYCKYYEKLLKEVKKRGEGSVKIKKTKKVKK